MTTPTEHPALAGLDDVPWKDLEDAYGPAEDVPDILRLLASEDPHDLKKGVSDAYANICHQGSRYTASTATVPFLYAILRQRIEEGTITPCAELLRLLLALAVGISDRYLPRGVPMVGWRNQVAAATEKGEPSYVQVELECYDAVQAGLETVYACLHLQAGEATEEKIEEKTGEATEEKTKEKTEEQEEETEKPSDERMATRATAARMLAFFPELPVADRSEKELLACLEHEKNPTILGTAMMSLAILHASSEKIITGGVSRTITTGKVRDVLRGFLTEEEEKEREEKEEEKEHGKEETVTEESKKNFLRWSAAVALTILENCLADNDTNTDSAAMQSYLSRIVQQLNGTVSIRTEDDKRFPFGPDDLAAASSKALSTIRHGSRYPDAARALMKRMAYVSVWEVEEATGCLAHFVFEGGRRPEDASFADLTPLQQEAVRSLLTVRNDCWRFLNYASALRYMNLPDWKGKLERFIAGEVEG